MNLELLTPRELEDKFYKLCHAVNKAERAFRDAEKVHEDLYAFKDAVFAKLIMEASGKTNAEKERTMKVSEEYKNYIKGLHKAKSAMLDAKVEVNITKRNWETCRSILSSRNVERKVGV